MEEKKLNTFFEEYMTMTDFARELGTSRQYVHKLITAGGLSCYRVGRAVLIHKSELERMTNDRRNRHKNKAAAAPVEGV